MREDIQNAKFVTITATAAVAVMFALPSYADNGIQHSFPVTISATASYATGALSTANHGPNSEMIECYATGSYAIYCFAQDALGSVQKSCTVPPSSSPTPMYNVLAAMSSDTLLTFQWNSSGACTSIVVEDFSSIEPK